MKAQFFGEQFQVIIDSDVENAFYEIEEQLGNLSVSDNKSNSKKNLISSLMDTISGIFTPALSALIGGELLKGFLVLIVTFNWLSADSSFLLSQFHRLSNLKQMNTWLWLL